MKSSLKKLTMVVLAVLLVMGAVALSVLVRTGTAQAAVFAVTSPLDTPGAPFPGVPGELRWAINMANTTGGPDIINFAIGGGGPFTITPSPVNGSLPQITDQVTIDGYTQPGSVPPGPGTPAVICIELDGSAVGPSDGLVFLPPASGSVVRGLTINRFSSNGILMFAVNGMLIEANNIGTDITGMAPRPNGAYGIYVLSGSGNIIGGNISANCNVISANGVDGIRIDNGASANLVLGNYIGTNALGSAPLGNAQDGISCYTNAISNNIGIGGAGLGNIISGNGRHGVYLDNSFANFVEANFIGTDFAGITVLPNTSDGVCLANGATNNFIGGSTAMQGNLISGNGADGVGMVTGANGNIVSANYIGTDIGGTVALKNTNNGVYINAAAGNTVGGDSTAGYGNLISGNGQDGVYVTSTFGNKVLGNYIGTDVNGSTALANGLHGVELINNANGSTVGGNAVGAGNVISGNTSQGVLISNSNGNVVSANYVGTDAAGGTAVPNACGIRITNASGNTIGGATGLERNLVSGNTGDGMAVWGSSNNIYGNYVGTNAAGATALPNGGRGIALYNGATLNNIGGGAAGQGNLISGNTTDGIDLTQSTSNTIRGNLIGTDAAGTAAVPNRSRGVYLQVNSNSNTIGGGNPGEGNVISGNRSNGIQLNASTNCSIQGNRIGTNQNGTAAMANVSNGIQFTNNANNNTVGGNAAGQGNLVSGNGVDGVSISNGVTGINVRGNYIGTDAAGTGAIANGASGVYIVSANGNTVGGTTAGDRNILSGNTQNGVAINTATTGNTVIGNYIGTDVNGTAAVPNRTNGVVMFTNANNNTLGGAAAGARNIISGNLRCGVSVETSSTGNRIRGNYIGTDVNGTAAVPNSRQGIFIAASNNNTVGGSNPGEGNLISGNLWAGVSISASTGCVCRGNYIGTDVTGTLDRGNGLAGVHLSLASNNNAVGGSNPGEGNLISGNNAEGISIDSSTGNNIQGNLIGTDASGTADLGNSQSGVSIVSGSNNNAVGGAPLTMRNVISGNGLDGVNISGSSGNTVQRNLIGTDASGALGLGNGGSGIVVTNGATGTLIGDAAVGNVVSGNYGDGLQILNGSTGTGVFGNFFGIDGGGGTAIPNAASGVYIWAADGNTIGSAAFGSFNVISGNNECGICIGNTTAGNTVDANYIGTDLAGTGSQGNTEAGVYLRSGANNNLIGGDSTTGAGNVISGNGEHGVLIDASGSNQVRGNLIGLDATGGAGMGNYYEGVALYNGANNNTIGGPAAGDRNIISDNGTSGIIAGGSTGSVIQGNYVGTDATCTTRFGNAGHGVWLLSGANGSTLRANLISCNVECGVNIESNGNTLEANQIGTDAAGSAATGWGNRNNGIAIGSGGNGNTVGGNAAGEGNLISGNAYCGVYMNIADSNIVSGNLIGTDAAGTSGLGNGFDGVGMTVAYDNTIGGAVADERNIISGNNGNGVSLVNSAGNSIFGNYIGTDTSGTAALPNSVNGIYLTSGANGNLIGGSNLGEGNVVSGNWSSGICAENSSDGNTLQGNIIGSDPSGTLNVHNWGSGIFVYNAGSTTIDGNLIRYNGWDGIALRTSTGNSITDNMIWDNPIQGVGLYDAASYLNRISQNSIYNNPDLGIDIMVDGVTPNDGNNNNPAKSNRGYNFPVFSSSRQPLAGGILTLTGTAPPNAHVEFYYVGAAQDPTGHGQGYTYLGTTDADSAGDFFCNLSGTGLVDGNYISAIAISPSGDPSGEGNTSEFSENARVTNGYAIDSSVNGGHGTVDPAFQAILPGDPASVDIIPDAGYHLFFITDNTTPMPLADPYVIPVVGEDHDVVVIYDIDKVNVNAYVTGGHGSVSPAGQSVNYGSSASVDITPAPGYHIETITDNDVPQTVADPYDIASVTEVHNVVVTFAADTYDVNATVFFGGGSVNPAYQSVAYDGTASIDLIPDTGYHAAYILDNGVPATVADPYVVSNVREAHDVVVFFEIDTNTISASVDPVGSGSVSGAGAYDYGSTCTLTATPAAGWSFVNWTEGAVEVSTDAAYSFTVTGPRTLVAHFTEPWVNSIMPKYLAAPGPVSATLNGSGFKDGATVRLTRMGSPDVAATNVVVVSDTQITCGFDLTGAVTGAWNLSFTNPDGGWNSLHDCFFVGGMSGTGWGYNGSGQTSFPDSNDFVQAAAGDNFSLGLRSDGSIAAWGDNGYGQLNVPAGYDYVQVAAGSAHCLALRSDGTLHSWGYDDDHQVTDTPTDSGYVAIAAGMYHSMALRSDGSMVAWGLNGNGQCNVPAGRYVKMAGGNWHTLAVRADGSLAAWGYNTSGQCNVPAGKDFVEVDAGAYHSLALRADGSLAAWGDNGDGQCNVPAGKDFIAVAAGQMHGLAVRADSSVAAWGFDGSGQVGGTPTDKDFVAVSGGAWDSLVLCRPFEVTASVGGGGGGGMVDPASQQIGFGRTASIDLLPDAHYQAASITDNSVPIAGPYGSTYVITNVREAHDVVVTFAIDTYTITASVGTGFGSVDGGGVYDYGSTCYLDANPDIGYHFVNWTEGGTEVSTDELYDFTVTADRDLVGNFAIDTFAVNASVYYTDHGGVSPATQTIDYGSPATIDLIPDTGYSASYILDNGVPVTVADPYVIASVKEAHSVIAFFAPNSYFITASVDPAGSGSASGAGTYDYGATVTLTAMPATGWHFVNWTDELGAVVSTDATFSFTCSGVAGFTAHFATAVVISAMPKYSGDASSMHLADLHGSGFLPGATVKLTRAGSTEINATGVVVVSDTQISCDLNLAGVATGAWNVTVTNPDGGSGYLANAFFVGTMSVNAWGENGSGQGNVPAGNDYVAIAAGSLHSVALKSDGSLAAWGDNSLGQCNVPAGNDYVAITAGMYHNLALKADGSLFAWGNNYSGQCNVPVGNDFVAVSAGWEFSLALKADGSIVAWGGNDNHECDVPAGNNYVAIAAGSWHGLALKADGSLAAWGRNDFGQGGVPAGNDYVAISAGALHNLVLKTDGSLAAWGWDSYGQVGNTPAGHNFTAVNAGQSHSVALKADGSLAAWGDNGNGQCNILAGNDFTAVEGGGFHSLALCRPYKVAASVGGGGGTVDPTYQRVGYGRTATIDLYPDTNWHVASITDNGVPVPSPYGSTYVISSVKENHDVEVTFALDTYTITATPDGNGTVDGAGVYDYGSTCYLQATPAIGWHFVNWTEGGTEVSTDELYSFTVTANRDLVAHFAIDTFTVNAAVYYTGHGGATPATQTIDYGSPASITLTPETGYHVAWITDNGVPVPGPYGATYDIASVTAGHEVIVTFAINTYTVDASVTGGHGAVDPATQTRDWGTKATVDIMPEEGYHIASITDNGTPAAIANPYVINPVTEDHAIEVTFAINTYAVTASVSGGHGTATPATQTINWGGDAAIDITPIANYHIASITDNGVSRPLASPYVISNVREAHNVVATFAIDTSTWYLAEGCTAGGTETWILVENPNTYPVAVSVSFLTSEGIITPTALQGYVLAANSRVSFNAGTYAESYQLSTVVSSAGGKVICERAMYGNSRTWGTDSIGTEAPATTWYLAEGSTGPGFETWVLVQNPGDNSVTVDLNFMTSAGLKAGPQDVTIPAKTRKSFNLGDYVTDYDVSTVVSASGGVVAERAMYGPGRAWAHDSIGTPAPAPSWYLAEGSTGPGFETWVLVQNPGATPVTVDLTLMTGAGRQNPPALQDVTIPARSRKSFNLGDYVTDYDVSTLVSSTGGNVIAERSMYNTTRTWGTCSIGATSPAATWYLAEGSTGEGFETWVLVQNPGTSAVTVDLTFMTSSGPKAGPQDVTIGAGSRKSFNVADYVTDYNVSTAVTSTGGGVVCERAMYGNGRTWAHDSIGYAP